MKTPAIYCWRFLFLTMNKFKHIACLLLLMGSLQSYAQLDIFTLGAKVGINQGQLTKSPNLGSPATTGSFVAGVFSRVKFLSFYAGPEVVFTQRRGVFKDDSSKLTITNTFSYIDIPVLVGVKLSVFRAYAGPNFQFLLKANQSGDASLKDANFNKSNFNSSTVGIQAGIGVDLGNIVLDLRYDGSLGDMGKEVISATGQQLDYSTQSRMVQLTIGYKFL